MPNHHRGASEPSDRLHRSCCFAEMHYGHYAGTEQSNSLRAHGATCGGVRNLNSNVERHKRRDSDDSRLQLLQGQRSEGGREREVVYWTDDSTGEQPKPRNGERHGSMLHSSGSDGNVGGAMYR